MKRSLYVSLIMIAGLVSCNDLRKPDDFKTKDEINYELRWIEAIGSVDPEQAWEASTPASIEIRDAGNATISIYSLGEAKRVLLAREEVSSSATLEFDIPSGLEYGLAICSESADGVVWQSVSKASLQSGKASVSFANLGTKADAEPMTDEKKQVLTAQTLVDPRTGKNAKIYGYTSFPAWLWHDINMAIPEEQSATNNGQITNFELQSHGVFYISTIYGSTGNQTAEVGYYYYDPASPTDITFIPLIDALKYDYYYDNQEYTANNALPKVMWADKSWKWTPANFCYYDKIGGMASNSFATRTGDNQYNTLDIEKQFGNEDPSLSGIAQIKGLTFQVDAPVGNMVGFYCKKSNTSANYTTISMNNGKNRAAIKVYDGFRFIGLEDGSADHAREPDCNDIAFVMVPGNDGVLPGLLLPFIKDITEDKYYNGDGTLTETPKFDSATHGKDEGYEELASPSADIWTIAFEDMVNSEKADFDFNDVVIALRPVFTGNGKNEGVYEVLLCATGGSVSSTLFYDDTCIGEVHELLGSIENGKNVIANTYTQKYAVKKIHEIPFKKGKDKIEDLARGFKLVAGQNVIAVPKKSEIPKALLVPGFWSWPKENVSISDAYPRFKEYATSQKQSQDWYKKAEKSKIINF